jgi:hypothetical protein
MAEVAVPGQMFADILIGRCSRISSLLIARLRALPAPA